MLNLCILCVCVKIFWRCSLVSCSPTLSSESTLCYIKLVTCWSFYNRHSTLLFWLERQTMHVRARVWRHMHVCNRERGVWNCNPCLRRNRRTQLLVLTADGVCVRRLIVHREECLLSTAGIFWGYNFYLKMEITAQRADLITSARL